MTFFCVLRMFLCVVLLKEVHVVTGDCPVTWNVTSSGSCFKCLTNSTHDIGSIITASDMCKSEGGALASLKTFEDAYLAQNLLSKLVVIRSDKKSRNKSKPHGGSNKNSRAMQYAYIGLNDIISEGNFEWVDNSPPQTTVVNWEQDQPNDSKQYGEKYSSDVGQDCAVLSSDGELNDTPCCSYWGFGDVHFTLCEYDRYENISDNIFRLKCNNYSESHRVEAATSTESVEEATHHSIASTFTVLSNTTFVNTFDGTTFEDTTGNESSTDATLAAIGLTDAGITTTQTNSTTQPITTLAGAEKDTVKPKHLSAYCWSPKCRGKGTIAEVEKVRVLKNETNAYRRLFISYNDSRPSCAIIGFCACVILLVLALFILIIDIERHHDVCQHGTRADSLQRFGKKQSKKQRQQLD